MHPDQSEYFAYMGRARLDKAINTLLGILQGITIDLRINDKEVDLITNWINENSEFKDRHPINEIMPALESSIADGYLDEEERLDLLWICEKLQSNEYYDRATSDMQVLHGLLAGIVADGYISDQEIHGLSEWILDHSNLLCNWPYDEVSSLLTGILSDGKIDDAERRLLQSFFSEFVGKQGSPSINNSLKFEGAAITGLCAVCPEISFPNSIFCFTGSSPKYTRSEFAKIVEGLNGWFSKSLTQEVDYLVIGAQANPCWAYACYGRKVEKAVELRKQGFKLLLVHENDFLDAVADACARQARNLS